jgi:hypothetical protein
VNSITIGFNWSQNNNTIFIWNLIRFSNWNSSIVNCILISGSGILNLKSNILNSISVIDKMVIHLFRWCILIDRTKNKSSTLVVSNNVARNLSIASLQAFVSEVVKSKPWSVVRSCLFGVSYPESDMIYIINILPKANILPKLGLSGLLSIWYVKNRYNTNKLQKL